MAGWSVVENDDGLTDEERATLRERHSEMRRGEAVAREYEAFLTRRFDSLEKATKKDRICSLLRAFGRVRTPVVSDVVGTSRGYIRYFSACGGTSGDGGGITLRRMGEAAHERGEPYVVVERHQGRSSLDDRTRRTVFERDGHECRRCSETDDLDIHHITPKTRGGSDELENLAALCRDCHDEAVIVGADRQVTAYPPGEFEAWLDDNLDNCAARTAQKRRCQNPAGSCPHH